MSGDRHAQTAGEGASPARLAPTHRVQRWAAAITIAVVVGVGLQQTWYAYRLGNRVSPVADTYSEADAIRSGEGYAARGFAADSGLPDLMYGDRFPEVGVKNDPLLRPLSCGLYSLHPPAPNWILGLMTIVCGPGAIRSYRVVPIACGVLALAFLARSLLSVMGPGRGAVAMALLASAPMSYVMMHGLHYQGYALSLLLVQLGLTLRVLRRESGFRRRDAGGLLLLGFAQGWFSYDYVFLVCLSALPLWLLQPPADGSARLRRLLGLTCLPGAGFALAATMHFAQVVHYTGSVGAAANAYREVVHWRLGSGAATGFPAAPAGKSSPWSILKIYLFHQLPRSSNLAKDAYLLAAIALVGVSLSGTQRVVRPLRSIAVVWQPAIWRGRRALALFCAFCASALWILLMRNHAYFHTHYLPRHFYLLYFTAVVLLLDSVTIERVDAGERRHSPADG